MFTVIGYLDGVPYTLAVDGPVQEGGVMAGSPNVLRLLATRHGDVYKATPTGPSGTLDIFSPAAILGALMDWTEVRAVTGDPPDILGGQQAQPGVVY
jgi:hypothetical protein